MATQRKGTTLQSINAQIAALQAKADALRKKEIGEVIAKIKDAIAHYGLTATDLGLASKGANSARVKGEGKSAGKPAAKKSKGGAGKSARPAKYRDDEGHTWGGMGKRPDWFKAALAAGKTPEDLLVKS
jgi:DNA-binding protein H-NS